MKHGAIALALMCCASIAIPATPAEPAQAPVIRFAPPLDTPLAYRITQYLGTGEGQRRFGTVRSLHFVRDGAGYRLTVTVRDATGDAPAASLARFRAALSPLIGVAQVLRIDGTGRITGIDNIAQVWDAFMQGQRALLDAPGMTQDRRKAVQAAVADMERLDMAGRLMVLAGDVQPLMLFASGTPLPSMRPDAAIDGQAVAFTEEDAANGIRARYSVAHATGLVLRAERQVNQPPRIIREIRALEPLTD